MTIYKRGVYDVEVELEKLGYDYDALLEELIYQITNQGVLWENNDEAYRNLKNENEKITESNNRLKFYQNENLRLASELFASHKRYDVIKKQLHNIPIILDPVIFAKSGTPLLKKNCVDLIINDLILNC